MKQAKATCNTEGSTAETAAQPAAPTTAPPAAAADAAAAAPEQPAEAAAPPGAAAAGAPAAALPASAAVPEECTELVWAVRGGGGRGRNGANGAAQAQNSHKGNLKQQKYKGLDPVVPVTDAALLDAVEAFYGLTGGCFLRTHLVTRCMDALDKPRRCYYVSDSIKRVLMMDEGESLKVTSTGLKVRSVLVFGL